MEVLRRIGWKEETSNGDNSTAAALAPPAALKLHQGSAWLQISSGTAAFRYSLVVRMLRRIRSRMNRCCRGLLGFMIRSPVDLRC